MIADLNLIAQNLERLIEANDGTYKRWIAHADKLLHIFLAGRTKLKYQADDIVHSIILKLLVEKRKWDYQKYPDFGKYFCLLIKSEVSNLAKFEEKFIEIEEDEEEPEDSVELFIDRNRNLSLEEILNSQDALELESRCMKLLEGDDDALLVFLELMEGRSNKETAESLGVEISFVENTKKRIRRRLGMKGIGRVWQSNGIEHSALGKV
ncbi:MAG: hypothetical protein NTX65_03355 [Ignavibacteriales bacterium]|nr:hypothetical protein [Ignavibacteriales bacterium]